MKVRYPHVSIALAIVVLLASASVSQVCAVSKALLQVANVRS